MRPTVRIRFWLEAGLASLSAFLAVLTVSWRDWVEAITGFSPDRHSGSLECAIVAVLLFACVLAGLVARSEWLGPRTAFATRR